MAADEGFGSVRIDTHPGNIPMQRAIEKAGFVKCGMIKIFDGPEKDGPRIAYEKILK